jgi:NAD(P)H-hydrate epimerase
MKQGLLTGCAPNYTGTLLFSDLDVPREVYCSTKAPVSNVARLDINSVRSFLTTRQPASHKGEFGHVVVVGGDRGYGGAALMAAEAAQRSGAGLVSVITRSEHRAGMLARRPELMVAGTEDPGMDTAALIARASVLVVGPGLGRSTWGEELLLQCLAAQVAERVPLVIDADGLNLLSDKDAGQVNLKRDTWILTPHPGEAARLLDVSLESIKSDRFAAIDALQDKWGGTCLLKGAGSLLKSSFDPDTTFLCNEGNAGMATGGMGDVLAGIIAALVAQGLTPDKALQCAVCVHGEAADMAAAECGQRGLLATDLLPYVRLLLNSDL